MNRYTVLASIALPLALVAGGCMDHDGAVDEGGWHRVVADEVAVLAKEVGFGC